MRTTQNDRAMDDNAGGSGREKERRTAGGREGKHESTKATGKVSARARGIRVVEKGAKRLPDVPPEEKRWKY